MIAFMTFAKGAYESIVSEAQTRRAELEFFWGPTRTFKMGLSLYKFTQIFYM